MFCFVSKGDLRKEKRKEKNLEEFEKHLKKKKRKRKKKRSKFAHDAVCEQHRAHDCLIHSKSYKNAHHNNTIHRTFADIRHSAKSGRHDGDLFVQRHVGRVWLHEFAIYHNVRLSIIVLESTTVFRAAIRTVLSRDHDAWHQFLRGQMVHQWPFQWHVGV